MWLGKWAVTAFRIMSGIRLCPEEMVFKNTTRGIKIPVFFTAEKFQLFYLSFSKTGTSNFLNFVSYIWESLWYHSFSAFEKFSKKLTFLTSWYVHTCSYQGERNVSFSENFAGVRNEWSPFKKITYWNMLEYWPAL